MKTEDYKALTPFQAEMVHLLRRAVAALESLAKEASL